MSGGGGITDYLLPAAAVAAPFALGPLMGTAAAAGGGLGATGATGAGLGAMSGLGAGALPAAGSAAGLFGGTAGQLAAPTLAGAASPLTTAALAPEVAGGFGVANAAPGFGGFLERAAGQFTDPQSMLKQGMEQFAQPGQEEGQPPPPMIPMEAPGGPIAQSSVGPAAQGQGFGGPGAYRPPPTAPSMGGGGAGLPPELAMMDPIQLQMLLGKGGGLYG